MIASASNGIPVAQIVVLGAIGLAIFVWLIFVVLAKADELNAIEDGMDIRTHHASLAHLEEAPSDIANPQPNK